MKNLSARNPLGIIALFISLIYGISALLLGSSIGSLTPWNQERLVWFIVVFPIAVLVAFVYLVTRHHRKLYSPSDFRTDEGFLTSGDPSAIGEKYILEGVGGSPDPAPVSENDLPDVSSTGTVAGDENPISQPAKSPSGAETTSPLSAVARAQNVAAYAYMLEGLVLQDLQREFDSPIRRDTEFASGDGRRSRVDGIIETASGPVVVEIKILRPRGETARRIREGRFEIESKVAAAQQNLRGTAKGILVLVLDSEFPDDRIELVLRNAREISSDEISVRISRAVDLMEKYGLAPASAFAMVQHAV